MTGVEFAKLAVLLLMLAYVWAAGYAAQWRAVSWHGESWFWKLMFRGPVTVRAVVSAAFLLAGGFFLVMG